MVVGGVGECVWGGCVCVCVWCVWVCVGGVCVCGVCMVCVCVSPGTVVTVQGSFERPLVSVVEEELSLHGDAALLHQDV